MVFCAKIAGAASKLAPLRGEKIATSVDIPLSHSSKRVLAYGAEEADRLERQHIGSAHLFLGLLREESRAAEFLREHGVEIEDARKHAIAEAAAQPEPATDLKQLLGILQGRVSSSRTEEGYVESEHHVRGYTIKLKERMLLSPDGKILLYSIEIHGPDGQEHRHSIQFQTEPPA